MLNSRKDMNDIKKQRNIRVLLNVLMLFIFIGILAWSLKPFAGGWPLAIFSFLCISLSVMAVRHIREKFMTLLCVTCETNIFPFINLGKSLKQEVNHCPKCGSDTTKIINKKCRSY
jgi:hypothetical protein